MKTMSVRVIHPLKEGNTLAKFFPDLIFNFAGDFQFNNVEQVPNKGRAIIELDKSGTPTIRRIMQEYESF